MKPKGLAKTLLTSSALTAAIVVSFVTPSAHAASAAWTGTTDALWATTTNWTASPVPGTGDTATFNSAGNGNTTIDLGGGVTVNSIVFDTASVAAYTIGSGAINSQTLTLNNAGSVIMNATAANNQLFNSALTLGTDATTQTNTFTNNSTTNTLTFAGNITGGTGGTAGVKTLTVNGAGNTTISGALAPGGATALALTKSGTGKLTLSNSSNAITGAVNVAGGNLTVTGNLGTNTANAQFRVGTVAGTKASMTIGAGANITRHNLFVGDAGAGTGGGAVYQSGGSLTLTQGASIDSLRIGSNAGGYGYYQLSGGTVTTNEAGIGASLNNTVGVADISGGTFTSNGWITVGRGGGTSSGVLNVTGGLVEFSKTSGAADANNSRLALAWGGAGALTVVNIANGSVTGDDFIDLAAGNTAGATGAINLLSGGTLQGSRVIATNANPTALLNFNGGTLKAHTTNGGVNFLSSANIDAVTVYSGGGTIDNNGTGITIGKALQGATGNGVTSIAVTNGGSGYIGAPLVTITGGTGNTATGYAVMVDDGTGNGTFKVGSIVITSGGTYSVDPTTVTLSGGGATTAATLGTITTAANTSGGMTFAGSGTTTLTGVNTYTGGTTVGAGTLALGHATNALADTGAVNVNGGTLAIGANSDTVGAVTLTSGSITGSTGTLTGSSYAVQSGTVSAKLGGTGALTKSALGTVTLSGANTYTGATNINAGTLALASTGSLSSTQLNVSTSATFDVSAVSGGYSVGNGVTLTNNGTVTGSFTVGNGGTLKGTGAVNGNLTVASGGNVAPGNSPGVVTVNGNFDLQSGSTFNVELAGTSPGTEYDQLFVNGSVTLAGALSLTTSFVPVNGDLFFILVNDGADAINGTFAGLLEGGTFTVGGQDYQITYQANFEDTPSFTGGNDVALLAVPEPAAALLGGLGMLGLLRRRRVA